jgi:two-component system OmpR family response regulator
VKDGSRVNIALLEDNPSILDFLTRALEMAGHSVRQFIYSDALLQVLFNQENTHPPFDVLLVDLLLPGDISGLNAIRAIRESRALSHLPIVIISACAQKELDEIQEELPDVPILRKPFKITDLLHTLDETVKVAG